MATLLWQRDISSEIDGVKHTFSGWDQCMTKAYCKWPVIAAIILGCVIAFSLVWCLFSCLCGCVSCMTCCTSCCTSCCSCCGNNHARNKGYTQPTPQLQPYQQYASQPPPMYHSPPQQHYANTPTQPRYAQFDMPSKQPGASVTAAPKSSNPYTRFNEDALPAMPSWDNARVTRTPTDHDVEMEKLNSSAAAPMLPKTAHAGAEADMGLMGGPMYQDTAYHSTHPAMAYDDPYVGYAGAQQQQSGTINGAGFESYHAPPPSYRTAPSSVVAPVVGRKPVSGSWRDI